MQKSNPDWNLMILFCPKFQHFSLFVNLQIKSVLCKKKTNKCCHRETLNIYFGLQQIKLLDKKAKVQKSDKVLTGTGSNTQW